MNALHGFYMAALEAELAFAPETDFSARMATYYCRTIMALEAQTLSYPPGWRREVSKCPTCMSPRPHLHPAVQCGGEVEVCTDDFHLRPTPQNTPAFIASVQAKRAALNPLPQAGGEEP